MFIIYSNSIINVERSRPSYDPYDTSEDNLEFFIQDVIKNIVGFYVNEKDAEEKLEELNKEFNTWDKCRYKMHEIEFKLKERE